MDAGDLISEALEQLILAADSESKVKLDLEKIGSALEAPLTFLRNASTQTSDL